MKMKPGERVMSTNGRYQGKSQMQKDLVAFAKILGINVQAVSPKEAPKDT